MLTRTSYGPYARAMVRICKEESFHQRQGYEIMLSAVCRHRRATGDGPGRPRSVVVALAHDVRAARRPESTHTEQSVAWKIKRETNDDLRQRFVDMTVPQAEYLGLTVPDPDLRWNDDARPLRLRQDRLGRVLAGRQGRRPVQPGAHGPQGGRLGRHAWVREAAAAHAAKKQRVAATA
jgi:ring-1,2-phenylacetyl-CoA epoxidase subunit PaaA